MYIISYSKLILFMYLLEVKVMSEDNIVYIGNKPVMNYVLAVVTQMNGGTSEVILKARGRAISRAVDVAEIVRNRFITEAELGTIDISTEEVSNMEGSSSNVSAIEIQLNK
jgi:archaea-specific DNA-binding protein